MLTGTWGWYASALAVSYDVQCVVINPSAGIRPGEGLSVLLVGRQVPLAAQCARGTAIDAKGARDVRIVAGCIAAVRVGGRIVAPSAPPPAVQARELASDAQWWVGERIEGGGSPIPITRARPSPVHGIAKSFVESGRTRTVCLTHSGTSGFVISPTS